MHAYAMHLMDMYGEQYVVVELVKQLNIKIRIRFTPNFPTTLMQTLGSGIIDWKIEEHG